MAGQPWMRFFPADWRADPALRVCSIAARGLWIEMLAIMHEATPRGHLTVKGVPVTPAMLSALAGLDQTECGRLLAELEAAGVFDRRRNGVIVSRRMVRDEARAQQARENGARGGNPALVGAAPSRRDRSRDNPADKPAGRTPHKRKSPDARVQNDTESADTFADDAPPDITPEMEEALNAAAGAAFDAASPQRAVMADALAWLAAGCDWQRDVLPAVRAAAARKKPGTVRSWAYFSDAVLDHFQRRTRPPPAASRRPSTRSPDPTAQERLLHAIDRAQSRLAEDAAPAAGPPANAGKRRRTA